MDKCLWRTNVEKGNTLIRSIILWPIVHVRVSGKRGGVNRYNSSYKVGSILGKTERTRDRNPDSPRKRPVVDRQHKVVRVGHGRTDWLLCFQKEHSGGRSQKFGSRKTGTTIRCCRRDQRSKRKHESLPQGQRLTGPTAREPVPCWSHGVRLFHWRSGGLQYSLSQKKPPHEAPWLAWTEFVNYLYEQERFLPCPKEGEVSAPVGCGAKSRGLAEGEECCGTSSAESSSRKQVSTGVGSERTRREEKYDDAKVM